MERAPATTLGDRRAWLVLTGLALAAMLLGLACAGANVLAIRERIIRRTIVLHQGQWALSVEITYTPGCAPLEEACWQPHYRADRPKYFSTWLYRTSPPNVPWRMTSWHIFSLRLDPDG